MASVAERTQINPATGTRFYCDADWAERPFKVCDEAIPGWREDHIVRRFVSLSGAQDFCRRLNREVAA